jgi:hypothetical protein
VIELVVGATVTTVGRFLPYTAAAMMAGDTNGGGMPQIPRGVAALPYPVAIAVLAAIAVAVAAGAAGTVKVGRNVPCPCGSGRKFKGCAITVPAARPRPALRSGTPPAVRAGAGEASRQGRWAVRPCPHRPVAGQLALRVRD